MREIDMNGAARRLALLRALRRSQFPTATSFNAATGH
jgi:hypothetical protein